MGPCIPTLTCIVVVTGEEVPEETIAALAVQAGTLADHTEIVVVANGVGPGAAHSLNLLARRVPDLTVHFLADAVERDVATLIGMDRALGDWVVVATPTAAEVEVLPTLLAATESCEVVFAAAPHTGGSDSYGQLGRAFFGLAGLLAGARLEWPTPRLRVYSRAAVRWLANRLDGAILMRSLNFRGAFPGRRIELPGLATSATQGRLRPGIVQALRHLTRAGTLPLRIAIGLSVGGVFVGLCALAYVLIIYLTKADLQPGWTTLTGLLAVMMITFSALFALLTGCVLALYASIQPRDRVPVVREVRSAVRRLDRSLDVAGNAAAFGAPSDALPDIRPQAG